MILKTAFVRTAIPVLLIVLLATTFVLGRRSRRTDSGLSIEPIVAIHPADVDRIRIDARFSRPEAEPIILFRVPEWDGWAVQLDGATVPGRASRVEDFFGRILSTRAQRIVTREPTHHAALYVSGATADSVLLEDAERSTLVHILFGLPGRDRGSLYMRLGGERTVYAVDPAPSFFLTRESEYWADTRVFPVPIDIDRVEFVRYGDTHAFVREYRDGQDVWHDGAARVDAARVHGKLRALFGLQADTVRRAYPFVGDPIVVRLDDRREYVVTYSGIDESAISVMVRGPRLYETGTSEAFVYTVPRDNFLDATPLGEQRSR